MRHPVNNKLYPGSYLSYHCRTTCKYLYGFHSRTSSPNSSMNQGTHEQVAVIICMYSCISLTHRQASPSKLDFVFSPFRIWFRYFAGSNRTGSLSLNTLDAKHSFIGARCYSLSTRLYGFDYSPHKKSSHCAFCVLSTYMIVN